MDGKRKLARRRRKRAWLITGIILLAYACYAVWDYTAPNRLGHDYYEERRELGSAFGVRQAYVVEGLGCLVGEIEASRSGTELHFSPLYDTTSFSGYFASGEPYIRSETLPRTYISWRPFPEVLNEQCLPEDVMKVYEDARKVSARYLLALPWYVLVHPRIIQYVCYPGAIADIASLASGKCKLNVNCEDTRGIRRWERYYEGNRTSDGFILETNDSRLRLYVEDMWISAMYLHYDDDLYSRSFSNTPILNQIALYIGDGKCIAFAEDGNIVEDVFELMQGSLSAYWELSKLKTISGTAPDELAWARLDRGLKALSTKPERIHIFDNLYSFRSLLMNGPEADRNIQLAFQCWDFPYDEFEKVNEDAFLKIGAQHLLVDKIYESDGQNIRISYPMNFHDRAVISSNDSYYHMFLGAPSVISKGSDYRSRSWEDNTLEQAWYVSPSNTFPVLAQLPIENETEYSEMKQLADKLAENEKGLGEFGANPMVKRFISDLQNRRVSFRKAESGTTYKWEGTVCGSKVLWDLRWNTYASPYVLHVSFGAKEFQISGSVRISPSPGGYSQYYNGPLEPLTKEDWDALSALVEAEKIGVVKVPDAVKGGWDRLVQFAEGDKQFVETKLVNIYDRQTDEQLMELLN